MTADQPPAGQSGVAYPSGAVEHDLACRKCGYNLRTLSLNSRCPECGTAVGYSAQGDLLRFSEPTWVMTLHRGVVMILSGIAVIIAGVVIAIVIAFAGGQRAAQMTGGVIGVIGYGLMLIGSWLLTAPDPSGVGEDRYGTWRKLIRVALAVGLGSQLLELLNSSFPLPDVLRMLFLILQGLGGIVGLIGTFAQLQYIGKLAERIPDQRITDRANFLKYALTVSQFLLLLVGLVTVLSGLRGGGGGPPGGLVIGLGCFMGILGIVALVFGVMYLFMLDRLRKALKEQASYALQTWAAFGAAAPTV